MNKLSFVKLIFVLGSFFLALNATAATKSVCDRHPQISKYLAAAIKKKCSQITEADLLQIKDLDLSSLKITSFQASDFSGLQSLETIKFRTYDMQQDLPGDLFSEIKQIKRIDFLAERLTSLHPNIFKGLYQLKELSIYNLEVDTLPEDLFVDLVALETLTLNYTQIVFLPETLFRNTTALKYLNLHYNTIKQMPVGLLRGLYSLVSLDLSSNGLQMLPDLFFKGTHIKDLNLNENAAVPIQAVHFSDLRSLETLQATGNKITSLPDRFILNFPKLKYLNLGGNCLSDEETEKLTNAIPADQDVVVDTTFPRCQN